MVGLLVPVVGSSSQRQQTMVVLVPVVGFVAEIADYGGCTRADGVGSLSDGSAVTTQCAG